MSEPQCVKIGVFGAADTERVWLSLAYIKETGIKGASIPSIEDEFFKKTVIDGKTVHVGIIVDAGYSDFKEMRARTYQESDGFVLVYSNDRSSLTASILKK